MIIWRGAGWAGGEWPVRSAPYRWENWIPSED